MKKTIKTQFGQSAYADFEDNTLTFEMTGKMKVVSGHFAIVDKAVYDEMLKTLKQINELAKCSDDRFAEYSDTIYHSSLEAIRKLTKDS